MLGSFSDFAHALGDEAFREALFAESTISLPNQCAFLREEVTAAEARRFVHEIVFDRSADIDLSALFARDEIRPVSLRDGIAFAIQLPEFTRDFPLLLRRRGLLLRLLLDVHIPKCGGHTLYRLFENNGYRPWHRRALEFTGRTAYLQQLAGLLGNLEHRTYLVGHYHLRNLLPYLQPGDPLLILIRDPFERFVSRINFMFTVLARDPALTRPDSQRWAQMLGGRVRPEDHSLESFIEHPTVQQRFMRDISRSLDLAGLDAPAHITATVIELRAFQSWLDECGERHGLSGSVPQENVSKKFFRMEMLSAHERKRLRDLMQSDCVLHEQLCAKIGTRGYRELPVAELPTVTSLNFLM